MKKFFAKHGYFLSAAATFLIGIAASASTRCIAFVWHDEPEAPAFLMDEWSQQ